jgi:hypothetical protein
LSPTELARSTLPRSGEPISLASVAKPGGGTRIIATLDTADERTYSDAVARVIPAIESALGPHVFADRAAVSGGRVVLGDWQRARRVFRSTMRANLEARPRSVVFVGDVRACFPSMQVEVVAHALRRLRSRPAEVDGVLATLRGFGERGVAGLPVGPAPSAALANAVLLGIDQAIHAQGVQHLRWVDDVVAVCDDVKTAIRVADAFHRSLAREGLHANLSKTMIVSGPDQAAHHMLGSSRYSPAAATRAMLRAP